MGLCASSEPPGPPPPFATPEVPSGPPAAGSTTEIRKCLVPIKLGVFTVNKTADMSGVHGEITAAAARGFSLQAALFPVMQHGKRKGNPMDIESAASAYVVNCPMQLFFHRDGAEPPPLETKIIQVPVTFSHSFFGRQVREEEGGFTELYAQLATAANEGYYLSCIVDDPNLRCSGLGKGTTTVSLVCQRELGRAAEAANIEYSVHTIKVNLSGGMNGAVRSELPDLETVIQQQLKQGWKIATAYSPPILQGSGYSATTQLHIIFQRTQQRHCVIVADDEFIVNTFGRWSCTHSYRNRLINYSANGWTLVGVIDLPDFRMSGFGKARCKVRLVFQAAVDDAAPTAPANYRVQVPDHGVAGQPLRVRGPTSAFDFALPQGSQPGQVLTITIPH